MRTPTSEARRCAETTMPCSASTAGAASGPAEVGPVSSEASAPALANRLIQPLVIKSTLERRQLLAELLGMGCGGAGIKGFAVAPRLDQREVVGVPVPLQHVVSQIAVVLAAGFGLRLDQRGSLVFSGREDIDMSDYVQRPGRNLTLWCGGDLEAAMLPHPKPVDHRGLQLLPERRCGCSLAVRLGRLLVAPDFDDREPARPRDLLEHLEGETAVLLAAGLGILPGSCGGQRRLGRGNLKIDDGIDWAAHRFLRIDGPHCRKGERSQRKDQV